MITVPCPVQPAAAGDPAAAAAAVHVAGLRKRYGDVVALGGVELTIAAGEFFTLLGPSGSGKTTLLRLIAGFERPDAGRIELAGSDVTGVPPYARDVNTVFQDYALFQFGTLTIVVGHTTFCIVVVFNNLIARLRWMPGSPAEASMDLGARGWQTLRFVTLPLTATALVSGAPAPWSRSSKRFRRNWWWRSPRAGPGFTTVTGRRTSTRASASPRTGSSSRTGTVRS